MPRRTRPNNSSLPSHLPMDQNPSTAQPTDQNPEPPPAAISSLPPPTTTAAFLNPNPAAPTPRPPTAPQPQQPTTPINPQSRPPFNTRPWQQQPTYYSLPSPPLPDSTSPSVSAPPPPRGGMAIGVPAQMSSTPTASLTSPSYSQQSQIRQPMQGMGMTGTLGASPSSMRPSHPLRPTSLQSSPANQSYQGQGMLRVSSLGSSGSPSAPSPSSLQNQSQTQPWLSSGTQGKPPLPNSPSIRPQSITHSFQQRSHIAPSHQHSMPVTSQQQQQQQQQPISSGQHPPQPSTSQDHFAPQFSGSRVQQSITHQQQVARGPGLGSQRPTLGTTPSMGPGKTPIADTDESSNRIVSKRSIQDLVNQIDPSEKLDPEVEDILIDIAEDFVESITTFGCSLAKHRKSTTLEAKDIFLHLERNWNMTLPGFGGDEVKTYKKPTVSEIHKERLASVKKSILVSEMMSKNPTGPSGGNAKSHLAKGPATGNIGAT